MASEPSDEGRLFRATARTVLESAATLTTLAPEEALGEQRPAVRALVLQLLGASRKLTDSDKSDLELRVVEGTARVNGQALWSDAEGCEQTLLLENRLNELGASGFTLTAELGETPAADAAELEAFFDVVRSLTPPEAGRNRLRAAREALREADVWRIKLTPQPPDPIADVKLRGVLSLWHYGKAIVAMQAVFERTPIDVELVRKVAWGLVDAASHELDFLTALPTLGHAPIGAARRAVDVAVLLLATAVNLELERARYADLALHGLLHEAGRAYRDPERSEFTEAEAVAALAAMQLVDAEQIDAELVLRVAAGIEHGVGPGRTGPPFLPAAPSLLPISQLIALARTYIDLVRGTEHSEPLTPLQAIIMLLQSPPRHIDPNLVHVMATAVGFLPVGSVVELNNGDIAIVVRVERGSTSKGGTLPQFGAPPVTWVQRVRAASGEEIDEVEGPLCVSLLDNDSESWRIVRTLVPNKAERELIARTLLERPAEAAAHLGLVS